MSELTITYTTSTTKAIYEIRDSVLRSARSTNPDAELVNIKIRPDGMNAHVAAKFTTNMKPPMLDQEAS